MWGRVLLRAAAAAAACSLAACGGGQTPDEGQAPYGTSSGSTTGTSGTQPQGPPQDFEPEAIASIDMPWALVENFDSLADTVTLGDHLAYTYDDEEDVGVTAYQLDTGEIAWHASVQDGDSFGVMPRKHAPRRAGTAVVGAFATSKDGEGTSAGHEAIKVVALDAATGSQLWAREFAKDDDSWAGTPRVVGADGRRVLVSVSEEGYSEKPAMSVLLDAQTGREIWTDRDLDGIDLEKSVAVGTRDDGEFVGKSTSDGRQLWKRPVIIGEALAADPGPGLILANGTGAGDSLLLDPVTGKTGLNMKAGAHNCRYDGWTTTLCSGTDGTGSATVTAVDLRTARVLWRLPDEAANRVAPEVTSAWHGLVYAEANGPMTLAARTGKDVRTDIGLAPSMVNDRYGLVYDPLRRITDVYRARD